MLVIGLGGLLVGFALLAGLIPSATGNYSDQRFLLCAVMVGVTCFSWFKFLSGRNSQPSLGWFLWLFPLVLVFLSGELYQVAYRVEPLMFAFFFLGCTLLGAQLSGTEHLISIVKGLLSVIALLALVYGLVAVMNYGLALHDGNREIDRTIIWGFPNIRYWSHLATWLIPLVAAAQNSARLSTLPTVRALIGIAGALWWWMLFSTSARGSMLGLFCGSLLVIWLFRSQALSWIKGFGVQLLGGCAFWLVLTVLIPWFVFGVVELREVDIDSSGRMPLWREAWEMSLINFPFGLGPQAWLTHSAISNGYVDAKAFAHPHNMYLFWAAEYGWISIAALALAASGVFKALLTLRAGFPSGAPKAPIVVGFTAAVAAACVHAGVSAVYIAPASMLTGFLVLSIFFALLRAPVPDGVLPSRVWRPAFSQRAAGFGLVVSLLVGTVWMGEVWRYYQDNIEDRQTYKGQGAIYFPRFWSHGDFPRQSTKK